MIKEIINSLRKISSTTDNTLIVVSLYRHHHHHYHHYSSFSSSSYLYEKILLPRFDKCIEITNSKKGKVNNLLDIRIRNHKNHHNDGISKNSCRRFSLSERDLMQLILPTRWFLLIGITIPSFRIISIVNKNKWTSFWNLLTYQKIERYFLVFFSFYINTIQHDLIVTTSVIITSTTIPVRRLCILYW